MNAIEIIAQYIKLRDFIEKRGKEHAEELAPYLAGMKAIENAGAAMLIEQSGGDEGKANIATTAGTMFRQKWTSIKVADREVWLGFVTSDWDARNKFLTSAVSKKEIEEFIEVEKVIPPGLDLSSGYSIRFNKPKG